MKTHNADRLADVIAMVTFSFVTGFFIEVYIADMSVVTSMKSRVASIPLNILTARPYGVYRDYLLGLFDPQRWFSKLLVDFVAFSTFQVLVYIVVLYFVAGATWPEIIKAVGSVIVLFLIMGPPYSRYMLWWRRRMQAAFCEVEGP